MKYCKFLFLAYAATALSSCSVIGSHSANKSCPMGEIKLISGDKQSGIVNQALNQPVVLEVRDTCGAVRSGVSIFYKETQDHLIPKKSFTSNSDGIVSVPILLPKTAGALILDFSSPEIKDTISVNLRSMPSKAANVNVISGDNQVGKVSSLLPNPLLVKVTDAFNNPVPSTVVFFEKNGNEGEFLFASLVTNDQGQVSNGYMLGNRTGTIQLKAFLDDSLNIQPTVFSEQINSGVGNDIVKVSGDSQSGLINTILPNLLTVKVTDSFGNPVSGTLVSFSDLFSGTTLSPSSVLTDLTGSASASAALGGLAGADFIQAQIPGGKNVLFSENIKSNSATPPTVNFTTLKLVSGNNQSANANVELPLPVKVQVIDSASVGVPNVTVSFYSSPSGTFGSNQVNTDSLGFAQTMFTFGPTEGNYVISASAPVFGNGLLNISEYAIGKTPPPTSNIVTQLSIVSGAQQNGKAGATANPLIVKALDSSGNVVKGIQLGFNINSGGGSFSSPSVLTGLDGTAQSTYTFGNVAGVTTTGSVSVIGNSGISPLNFSYTSTAAGFFAITNVSGDSQSGISGTTLSTPIKIKATDQFGNAVGNLSVSFNSLTSGGSFIINGSAGSSVVTDSNGFAQASFTLGEALGTQLFSVTATDSQSSNTLQYSESSTLSTRSPDHLAYVAGNNQSAAISSRLDSPFIVRVVDVSGQPVPGYSVAFTINTSGGGSFSSTSSVTTVSVTTLIDGTASSPLLNFNSISGPIIVKAAAANLQSSPTSIEFDSISVAAGLNDGLVNPLFNLGTNFDVIPNVVIWDASSNGTKLIVGGNFTKYNGVNVGRLARIDTNGNLDTSFNTGGIGFDGAVNSIVQDPSTFKLYIGGSYSKYNSVSANNIIRLSSSGSRDSTFNIGTGLGGGFNGSVNSLALDSTNGLLYCAGYFSVYKGENSQGIARIITSGSKVGSLDQAFFSNILSDVGFGRVKKFLIDPKGRIVVIGDQQSSGIVRLNPDGSVDATFNFGYGFSNDSVNALAIDSFGKIILGGTFTKYNKTSQLGKIIRLNEDGSLDLNFNNIEGAVGFDSTVNSIVVLPISGKIIVGGNFSSYNNEAVGKIAALNSDGTLDKTFQEGIGFDYNVSVIAPYQNGNLAIIGDFTQYNSVSNRVLALIQESDPVISQHQIIVNIDGGGAGIVSSADGAINCGNGGSCTTYLSNSSSYTITATPDSNSSLVQWGGACSLTTGNTCSFLTMNSNTSVSVQFSNVGTTLGQQLNPFFNPVFGLNQRASFVRSDSGKLIIGGIFSSYNGYRSNNFIRLLPDGNVDKSFNVGTGFNGQVMSMVKDPSGNYIIGGQFTSYQGVTTGGLVRIFPNGKLDTTFNLSGSGLSGTALSLSYGPNGNLYVSGSIFSYNGTPLRGLLELDSSGKLESSFNLNSIYSYASISKIIWDSQGRIIIAGSFPQKVLRLFSNGVVDVTFNTGSSFDGAVSEIGFDYFGKLLVSGSFSSYKGSDEVTYSLKNFARLNADGSMDSAYSTTLGSSFNGSVNGFSVQSNGKVDVVGSFSSFNATAVSPLIRLNSDGTLDTTFNNNGIVNGGSSIDSIFESNSQVVVSGAFTSYQNNGDLTASNGLAILYPDANNKDLFATVVASINSENKITDSSNKISCGQSSMACLSTYSAGSVTYTVNLGTDYSLENWTGSCEGQTGSTCTLNLVAGQGYSVSAAVNYNGTNKVGSKTLGFTTLNGFNNSVNAVEKDGRGNLIVGGAFTEYNGTPSLKLVRLNRDGNIDSTFNPPVFNNAITKVLFSVDKKTIYVGGNFSLIGGTSTPGLVALNSVDGSLKSAFHANSSLSSAFITSDMKFDLNGMLMAIGGSYQTELVRLNPVTGLADPTFFSATNSSTADLSNKGNQKLAIDRNNRYVVSNTSQSYIVRFTTSGAIDTSFRLGTGFNSNISDIAIDSFGKIVVGGDFTTYNGKPAKYFARINSDGSLDSTFSSPLGYGFNGSVSVIKVLEDGKIAVQGNFNSYDTTAATHFAVINPDNTINVNYFGSDGSFVNPPSGFNVVNGQLLAWGYLQQYSYQTADSILSFNPVKVITPSIYFLAVTQSGSGSIVVNGQGISCSSNCEVSYPAGTQLTLTAAAVDTSSMFLGWGDDCMSNGKTTTCSIIMNQNQAVSVKSYYSGTAKENQIDLLFNSDFGFDQNPNLSIRNGTDKILVGLNHGGNYNDVPVSSLVQLNRDGTLDSSFSNNLGKIDGEVNSILILNGKIYIAGYFNNVGNYVCKNLARINLDGTLDLTFQSSFDNRNGGYITKMIYDGQNGIIIAGYALYLNGSPSLVAAKVDKSTGAPDLSFQVAQSQFSGSNNGNTDIVMDSSGNVYLGFNSSNVPYVYKLSSLGVVQTDFNYNIPNLSGNLNGIALDVTNKIIVYGSFQLAGGIDKSPGIYKLNSDGTVDSTFNTNVGQGVNQNSYGIKTVTILSSGDLLLGGSFSSFNAVSANLMIRIHADGSTDSTFNDGVGFGGSEVVYIEQGADGLLVTGNFGLYQGTTAHQIVILNKGPQ